MDNQLVRYATRETAVPWRDREVAGRARRLYNEVQVADFKAKASFALAASIMQGAVELDQVREQLAGGDPVRSAILADFEAIAFMKAKNIQRNLFGDFGF
jgi:hypothetical protein